MWASLPIFPVTKNPTSVKRVPNKRVPNMAINEYI